MNSTLPRTAAPIPHPVVPRPHPLRAACIAVAALLLAPGLRAQSDAPKPAPTANAKPSKQALRQKFVPPPADPARGNGADFSMLHHFDKDDPDVLMLMAHAGVGDSFPVQEEGKAKEFDLKIVSGDDDKLELETIWNKATNPNQADINNEVNAFNKKTLRRDGTTETQNDEFRFIFSYPSVTVASAGKDTTDKAMLIVNRIPLNSAFATSTGKGAQLFTMRFRGSSLLMLQDTLARAFPKDNVVLAASAENVRLPSFELRDVQLSELARTIEFLSEGRLSVEVVQKDTMRMVPLPGNAPYDQGYIWRIAAKRSPAAAAPVKMRSVAAPHLFSDEKKLERVQKDAQDMEKMRLGIVENGVLGLQGVDPITQRIIETQVKRLTSQKVFVLIGSEDGVAGLEGFIKAAEQRAAEEAAAKDALAAANMPKMRAVAAPHLFAHDERIRRFLEVANAMRKEWDAVRNLLKKEFGASADGVGRLEIIEPHHEQRGFVMIGSEEGIAGMESLIKIAEQRAADEDAQLEASDKARRAEIKAERDRDEKAKAAAELKAAQEREKQNKRAQ